MSYFQAILLGLVQGLTEFLPVSSSGHLALLQYFFKVDASDVLLFTVMLHLGTLISVCVMYSKDIWELIKELILLIRDLFTGKGVHMEERPVRKLGIMIIVATIPAAFAGLLFNDFFEKLYLSLPAIGAGLLITGFMMYFSEKMSNAYKDIHKMNFRNAIFIGILQAIAICPGISRSGSTLVGGLTTGLKRDFAVKFAFLISIPVILGSVIMEMPDAIQAGTAGNLAGPIIVGVAVAAISGIFAIKAMIKVVTGKKLSYFSYYVWVLGGIVLVYGLFFA